MEKDEEKAIQDALQQGMQDMKFEDIPDIKSSPINTPVKVGEVSVGSIDLSAELVNNDLSENAKELEIENPVDLTQVNQSAAPEDAPEQTIDEEESGENETDSPEGYGVGQNLEIPEATAKMAANSLLGMTNNVLKIGGGFFVKIKKSKDLIVFDEIIQEIDEQNTKNVNRIALDEEDQALLRPLLMQILKQRAKALTPEQQLIGAAISILIKKVQLMVSIKSENKLLEYKFQRMIDDKYASFSHQEETPNETSPVEDIPVEEIKEQEVSIINIAAQNIDESIEETIDLNEAA